MSNVICVAWTITPKTTPRPWVGCSRCGGPRPFRCSGKFRLNASGKLLDAWLIYKCQECDDTWNFPVMDRCRRNDVEVSFLNALEANDPEWVRRFAFDTVALGRKAGRVEEFSDVEVEKYLTRAGTKPFSRLEILVSAASPSGFRGDRLIANELGLSRRRIQDIQESGCLSVAQGERKAALNRPLRNGALIVLDLSNEIDAAHIASAAAGREI